MRGNAQPPKGPDADAIAANVQNPDQPFDINREMTNLTQGRLELDSQIKRMQESLAKRTALPYDPRLMALGIGLASPTKTGSFVESLGQGMGKYHEATVGEMERQGGIDKENLQLMMQRQALQQKLAGSGLLQSLGGGQAPAAPSQTAPSSLGAAMAAPVAGRPGSPATFTGFQPIGRRELIAGQQIGDPETEKFLFNLQKAEVEAKKAADAGFTEITNPYNDKKVKVRVETADGFFEAARRSATENNPQILVQFMAENGIIPARSQRNAQGQMTYETPKTAAEEAQEKERLTQTEKERATSSEKSAEQLKGRAQVAFDNTQTANDMISYVKANPEVFRLLNTGRVRDVVMNAMGAGIQTPGGSITLPVDRLKRMGLTNEQIDTLQMFASSAAQLNIQFRKTMQGQGQITEKESELAAQLGAMPSDSDVVIRMKSELLLERSAFDDKAYGAWLGYRNKGSYDEFLHSKEYKDIKAEYSETLKRMREANAEVLKKRPGAARPQTSAAPATTPATPAAPRSSSVPDGYIADPQTGVIRRKREGE
jgi:hypothetical protein